MTSADILYDEKYRSTIEELRKIYHNDRVVQGQEKKEYVPFLEGQARREAKGERIEAAGLTEADLYKLRLRCPFQIQQITALDNHERQLLEEIRNGEKNHFRQAVWGMEGFLDVSLSIQRYKAMVANMQAMRTSYLYRNLSMPVRVVYQEPMGSLQIADIRNMDENKQMSLLWNLLAAEARREYDPEKDASMRMFGFLLKNNQMIVVVSFYPDAGFTMGIRSMVVQIFNGMKIKQDILPELNRDKVAQMNRKVREESLAYWKRRMPYGKELTLPGERQNFHTRVEWGLSYKTLSGSFAMQLQQFCEKNGISARIVLLAAWGELLGSFHAVDAPVLAMRQSGEQMCIFPIRVERQLEWEKRMQDIKQQSEECIRYSSCSQQDFENLLGEKTQQFFHVLHHFVELQEMDTLGNLSTLSERLKKSLGEKIPDCRLNVTYHLFGKEIRITYRYRRDIQSDFLVEQLHQMLLECIKQVLSYGKERFQKEEYLLPTDTQEERMYKLQVAQNALYLKESNLLVVRSIEDLMEFAKLARLSCYQENDILLEKGQAVCDFAIVVKGYITESFINANGMVNSIRILKKGDAFGVESLSDHNIAQFTYSAMEEAEVLYLERDSMIAFLNQQPESWRSILAYVDYIGMTMKKLWGRT